MNQEENHRNSPKPHEKSSVCEISIWHRKRCSPWISRVFDAMGLVLIAAAFVIFFISWMADDTKFYIALCVSFFISGLLYTAVGEILRSNAETAANTAKLIELKELEFAEHQAGKK